MATNEDLYRELEDLEAQEDALYGQNYQMKPIRGVRRKEPDTVKALKRYQEEILPVLQARRRVTEGQGPTGNIIKDAWLKVTGQDKIPDLPTGAIVEPTKGLVTAGPTIEEVQKMIAENPEQFKDLARTAPEVRPVQAERKSPQDYHRD